jgi:DNA polymerase elongation subunit (family B)
MANYTTLIVDIETVGQDIESISPRAREILLNVADDEARDRVLNTLGLDPCTGKIICIGVYWMELDRERAYCQSDELELLANFWADLVQIRPSRFVTFNGKSFDFPYINVRSAILGVPAPRNLHLDLRRFATDRHVDVRETLTNFDRYKRGTLEYFCEIFGVTSPKDGIDGSKVGECYEQGRLDEIAHYCLADCKATAELYRRIRPYYR